MRSLAVVAPLFVLSCSHAPPPPLVAPPPPPPPAAPAPPAPAASPKPAHVTSWIERSNENASLLLAVQAEFAPEMASRFGLPGVDDKITDYTPGHRQRMRDAVRRAQAELEKRLAGEHDPLVAQDLQIMIDAARRRIKGSELQEKLEVEYENLPQLVFGSMRALLDAQIAAERRPAALVRLKKYFGLDGGTSIVQLAEAATREGLKKGLLPPSRLALDNELETSQHMIDGVDKLFEEFPVDGSAPVLAEMHKQLAAHREFVKTELLPKARKDFRLPPELYAFSLEQVGVDIPPAELAKRAHAAFTEIQGEMQKVAAKVAHERGWTQTDYRDVIKQLKKTQIPDDQVLEFYKKRLAQIEDIIRAHQLVTLPARPARIRIGTPAENAQQPAPHMEPPRLIGNTGEQGEFVLPLAVPGKTSQKYDDFNFDAAAWTLTAHEARPGHELQFSRMIESGVSLARALFAFNSVNVEGWGLYSEAITLPYMPRDGQLISLQLRLQRAARAFLDPELQIPGKWTPEKARAFLEKEVGISPAFATEEVDRFTFRSPGQATAYFYGYTRLIELRAAAEQQLGSKFDARKLHDAILAQGLLPPDLMRKAVLAALESPLGDAGADPAHDPARELVSRLDLEKYKATIKGLTRFGDRRQGTKRNRDAVDWIEAQLKSYGCTNIERITYQFKPAPPPAGAAAKPTPAAPGSVIGTGPANGQGGSRIFGVRTQVGINTDPARQPDAVIRALDTEPSKPGERQEVYCTKIGSTHPEEMYIVGGHMDGHGWNQAANDDGSGTALVMELARVFNSPDVVTERSIRFILWNNEETGLNGARAYVDQRQAMQGKESPAGSGKYPEPRWLGMIQHDMMLWDHGMPRPDGTLAPEQRPEADVNIEFAGASKMADAAMKLAFLFRAANEQYATDYPAAVGPHMTNTDSDPFKDIVPAITLREAERGSQIGAGWDPNWHQPTDVYTTYSDKDFKLGLNAAQTSLGALAHLAGAKLKK